MFSDLQNIIDFDTFNTHFTFIESNNIDGSFLIHHLLSYCIKREHQTLFLTIAQTLSHYKSIQVKLGNSTKLTKLIEKNVITHVDCLKFSNNFLNDTTNDENFFLNQLLNEVNQQFLKCLDYKYLIIDDLTTAYLLTNKKCYKKFYEFIFNIKNNHPNVKIVLYMQSFDNNDDMNLSHLVKDFAYLADLYFKVDQLATGYSKDIHGQVNIFFCFFFYLDHRRGIICGDSSS
jgi:hypothetical protein